MSTLRVNTLQNTSTTDGGISIDTSGHVTVDGVAMPSAGPLSNRNLIINGNFAINQRTGTNSSINTYALDRWRSYGGALAFTISQQDVLSDLSTSKYAMRFQRTSGNTQTNNSGVVQGIESKNCEGLAGTTLTLSFKARRGANLSGNVTSRFFYGTGTDQNPVGMTSMTSSGTEHTFTTSFATYTQTVTVPASTTQISIGFAYDPTGTAGADDWFEIAEVQVERGSVATPFEHRSYGQELALCQRYYATAGCIFVTDAKRYANNVSVPVEMRAVPTRTYYTDAGSGGQLTPTAGDTARNSTSRHTFYQGATHSTDSGTFVTFDAEL